MDDLVELRDPDGNSVFQFDFANALSHGREDWLEFMANNFQLNSEHDVIEFGFFYPSTDPRFKTTPVTLRFWKENNPSKLSKDPSKIIRHAKFPVTSWASNVGLTDTGSDDELWQSMGIFLVNKTRTDNIIPELKLVPDDQGTMRKILTVSRVMEQKTGTPEINDPLPGQEVSRSAILEVEGVGMVIFVFEWNQLTFYRELKNQDDDRMRQLVIETFRDKIPFANYEIYFAPYDPKVRMYAVVVEIKGVQKKNYVFEELRNPDLGFYYVRSDRSLYPTEQSLQVDYSNWQRYLTTETEENLLYIALNAGMLSSRLKPGDSYHFSSLEGWVKIQLTSGTVLSKIIFRRLSNDLEANLDAVRRGEYPEKAGFKLKGREISVQTIKRRQPVVPNQPLSRKETNTRLVSRLEPRPPTREWIFNTNDLTYRLVEFSEGSNAKKGGRPVLWIEALDELENQGPIFDQFIEILKAAPYEKYFFEASRVDDTTPAAFVLIDGPTLPDDPNPQQYLRYFKSDSSYAVFLNLDKTFLLVSPKPRDDLNYVTIGSYMRQAPDFDIRELWSGVFRTVRGAYRKKPGVWLSTHGRGIPWLHVRIGWTPKYYHATDFQEIKDGFACPDQGYNRCLALTSISDTVREFDAKIQYLKNRQLIIDYNRLLAASVVKENNDITYYLLYNVDFDDYDKILAVQKAASYNWKIKASRIKLKDIENYYFLGFAYGGHHQKLISSSENTRILRDQITLAIRNAIQGFLAMKEAYFGNVERTYRKLVTLGGSFSRVDYNKTDIDEAYLLCLASTDERLQDIAVDIESWHKYSGSLRDLLYAAAKGGVERLLVMSRINKLKPGDIGDLLYYIARNLSSEWKHNLIKQVLKAYRTNNNLAKVTQGIIESEDVDWLEQNKTTRDFDLDIALEIAAIKGNVNLVNYFLAYQPKEVTRALKVSLPYPSPSRVDITSILSNYRREIGSKLPFTSKDLLEGYSKSGDPELFDVAIKKIRIESLSDTFLSGIVENLISTGDNSSLLDFVELLPDSISGNAINFVLQANRERNYLAAKIIVESRLVKESDIPAIRERVLAEDSYDYDVVNLL